MEGVSEYRLLFRQLFTHPRLGSTWIVNIQTIQVSPFCNSLPLYYFKRWSVCVDANVLCLLFMSTLHCNLLNIKLTETWLNKFKCCCFVIIYRLRIKVNLHSYLEREVSSFLLKINNFVVIYFSPVPTIYPFSHTLKSVNLWLSPRMCESKHCGTGYR